MDVQYHPGYEKGHTLQEMQKMNRQYPPARASQQASIFCMVKEQWKGHSKRTATLKATHGRVCVF